MTVAKLKTIVALAAGLIPRTTFGQAVFAKDGNVFLRAKDGKTNQVTSSGLDSDPSLSVDKRLVVFVRRTPTSPIFTGLGPLDTNELWTAETNAGGKAHRVLAGRAIDVKSDELQLAGLSSPKFSPDARRVYFLAQIAATTKHVLPVGTEDRTDSFLMQGHRDRSVEHGRLRRIAHRPQGHSKGDARTRL